MTTTFKPGDTVRCIRGSFNLMIREGELYEVEEIHQLGATSTTIKLKNGYGQWYADRFELVKPQEENVNKTFKTGDRVRVTSVGPNIFIKVGEEYEVERVSDDNKEIYIYPNGDRYQKTSYPADRFELVQDKPAEISRYDDRLLPLFTTLAKAADDRGYCSEYDSLAALVGAPSRAKIKELNGPTGLEVFQVMANGNKFRLSSNPSVVYIKTGRDQFVAEGGRQVYTASTDIGSDVTTTRI